MSSTGCRQRQSRTLMSATTAVILFCSFHQAFGSPSSSHSPEFRNRQPVQWWTALTQFAASVVGGDDNNTQSQCKGFKPDYDVECGLIGSQSACEEQFVCRWQGCFGRERSLDERCASFMSDVNACKTQIGCVWRNTQALNDLAEVMSESVEGFRSKDEGMQSWLQPTLTSISSHGVKTTSTGQVTALVRSWAILNGWQDDLVDRFQVIVASESMLFRQFSAKIDGSATNTTLLVGAGRNWDGKVELAYVTASVAGQVDFDRMCDRVKPACGFHHEGNNNRCKNGDLFTQWRELSMEEAHVIGSFLETRAHELLTTEFALLRPAIGGGKE
eukprot:GFYU01006592.1.p1 GENE.GFYU01006592.1~~GFYU01006592.1.p1  ORF type:complete len:330 (+),score=17.36 GFYU01006592.1:163-1152(+)